MRRKLFTARPGPAAHLRSLLTFGNEVARNAVAEVRWRRQKSRAGGYGTGVTS
jgi:hypothetical protein